MKNYFNISAPPPPSPNILQPFCTDNRGITNTSNKDIIWIPYRLLFRNKVMLSPGLEQTTNPLSSHTFTRATQAQMKKHKWIAPSLSFILNPPIGNSRSYTDPKTQKCAAVRHYKIQQIPEVYKGTPNLSYLIQLPLKPGPEMSTGTHRQFNVYNASSES